MKFLKVSATREYYPAVGGNVTDCAPLSNLRV
jgi:hypothetical protein